MDCENCERQHTHWCTALGCRNKLKDRLAAYEDTGMEPEEIKSMVENVETRTLAWFEKEFGIGAGRMMDLAEADRAGRFFVSPFKVGDHVWINGFLELCKEHEITSISISIGKKTEMWFHATMIDELWEAKCTFELGSIGTTVFPTKEAAEAALKEEV